MSADYVSGLSYSAECQRVQKQTTRQDSSPYLPRDHLRTIWFHRYWCFPRVLPTSAKLYICASHLRNNQLGQCVPGPHDQWRSQSSSDGGEMKYIWKNLLVGWVTCPKKWKLVVLPLYSRMAPLRLWWALPSLGMDPLRPEIGPTWPARTLRGACNCLFSTNVDSEIYSGR